VIELLELATVLIVSSWSLASCCMSIIQTLRPGGVPQTLRFIHNELKPFYLPALAVSTVLGCLDGFSWNTAVHAGFGVLNWFLLKDLDDDDRWKRRKEKLVEKVSRSGSRLVVHPAGAS